MGRGREQSQASKSCCGGRARREAIAVAASLATSHALRRKRRYRHTYPESSEARLLMGGVCAVRHCRSVSRRCLRRRRLLLRALFLNESSLHSTGSTSARDRPDKRPWLRCNSTRLVKQARDTRAASAETQARLREASLHASSHTTSRARCCSSDGGEMCPQASFVTLRNVYLLQRAAMLPQELPRAQTAARHALRRVGKRGLVHAHTTPRPRPPRTAGGCAWRRAAIDMRVC